jgi:WD40 repeat protein
MMHHWEYGTQELHKADMLFEVNYHMIEFIYTQSVVNIKFWSFLSPGHGYHTDGLTCLSVTSDSQTIVSGSKDNSVCVVNINSGQVSVLMTQASVSLSCKLVHRLEFFLVLFENVCSLAFWYHHHRCRFAGCWLTGRPHWLYWVCGHLTKVLDP